MSIDLSVDAVLPMPLAAIVERVPECLRELLDVSPVPAIQIEELRNGELLPAPSDAAIDLEHGWLLGLDGFEASAFLAAIDVEDLSSLSSRHRFVFVSTAGPRTPLQFALMAAVAVVIARREGTAIVDDACFFTSTLESDVEAFVARVRARGPFTDLATAAEQFKKNLRL